MRKVSSESAAAGKGTAAGKGAKASEFNTVAGGKRICDLIQDGVHDILDVTVVEVRIACRNDLHQL